MPLLDRLFGVERLKKKRDKLREEVREVRQEMEEAREAGEKDHAQKLNRKRKTLVSRMRWYEDRIDDKEEG